MLIVGLNKGDSGRSCGEHGVCGEGVCVGDVLFFEPFGHGCEYTVHKGPCMVGYLKLDVARAHPAHHFSKRLVEVVELLSDDRDKMYRQLSYSFYGVARICLYPEGYTKHGVEN